MFYFVLFGFEVIKIFFLWFNDEWYVGDYVDFCIVKSIDFFGVIGQQVDFVDFQFLQYFDGDVVLLGVYFQFQVDICIYGIYVFVLQVIGFQFVDDVDVLIFLLQIQDYVFVFSGQVQSFCQLFFVIVVFGVKKVIGNVFRVQVYQNRAGGVSVFMDECQVWYLIFIIF